MLRGGEEKSKQLFVLEQRGWFLDGDNGSDHVQCHIQATGCVLYFVNNICIPSKEVTNKSKVEITYWEEIRCYGLLKGL